MSEHIKVELDFIPVEERLPEYEGYEYLVRVVHLGGEPIIIERVSYDDGDWVDMAGGCVQNEYWTITHWAEIPEIKT